MATATAALGDLGSGCDFDMTIRAFRIELTARTPRASTWLESNYHSNSAAFALVNRENVLRAIQAEKLTIAEQGPPMPSADQCR
jgi:hypothetical protein